jgi:hypothetical protein
MSSGERAGMFLFPLNRFTFVMSLSMTFRLVPCTCALIISRMCPRTTHFPICKHNRLHLSSRSRTIAPSFILRKIIDSVIINITFDNHFRLLNWDKHSRTYLFRCIAQISQNLLFSLLQYLSWRYMTIDYVLT